MHLPAPSAISWADLQQHGQPSLPRVEATAFPQLQTSCCLVVCWQKWMLAGTWPELLSGAGCLSAHQDPLAPVFAHICQKCACHEVDAERCSRLYSFFKACTILNHPSLIPTHNIVTQQSCVMQWRYMGSQSTY